MFAVFRKPDRRRAFVQSRRQCGRRHGAEHLPVGCRDRHHHAVIGLADLQRQILELFRNKRGGRLSSKNYGGRLPMGLHIRDERQMKALTGLSQAQFASLRPVFSDIYRATPQHPYAAGIQSGTRRRRPGGGAKGTLPTLGEK